MKLLFSFLSLFILFSSCNTSKPVVSEETAIISITHGTNFGHCRGYCRKEVIFSEEQVQYIESSVDSGKNPDKKEQFAYTEAQWKSLSTKVNLESFEKLEESYGCPDCADGGSEYIEIKTLKGTKRVTIEFNKEAPQLEPLLTELRAQRKALLKTESE